jgi:hypothetical protein
MVSEAQESVEGERILLSLLRCRVESKPWWGVLDRLAGVSLPAGTRAAAQIPARNTTFQRLAETGRAWGGSLCRTVLIAVR